jgi:hypothetical protein
VTAIPARHDALPVRAHLVVKDVTSFMMSNPARVTVRAGPCQSSRPSGARWISSFGLACCAYEVLPVGRQCAGLRVGGEGGQARPAGTGRFCCPVYRRRTLTGARPAGPADAGCRYRAAKTSQACRMKNGVRQRVSHKT